jgi:hypothetical protein
MNGPDLPSPNELFEVETWLHRWPTGTRKAELYYGVLVYFGEFDERDVAIAQNAYPGRRILLDEGARIEIHPASNTPPGSIFGRATDDE